MNKEVRFLNESDRKRVVNPEPLTIEQFVGLNGDPTTKENLEKYINYRIQFDKEIKRVKFFFERTTNNFTEIVYLGKTYSDDTFLCYDGDRWEIIHGELNSGLY